MSASTDDGDRLPYHDIWRREVRAGRHGQRLDRHSTWRLDNLWSAAVYQVRSEEAEQLLASAIDRGAHRRVLEALLADVEWERERAHCAYLGNAHAGRKSTNAA